MDLVWVMQFLGVVVVIAPALLTTVLGLTTLLQCPLSERMIGRFTEITIVTGLLASLVMMFLMLFQDTRQVVVDLGNWVAIPQLQFDFSVKFVFDRLSVPFVILSFTLCGTIGAFANRYMHREPGFNRFFCLYALFVLGMIITSPAGTIETMVVGWEMVGLSSALLVAFYHERAAPCRNGLRVWIVYRISNAGLIIAAIVLHHLRGHGEFSLFMGSAPWPDGRALLTPDQALLVGALLIVAAAGTSALVPFCGWLPRAMEGPTPSSAVFYGALSVHLGAYLLLRFAPMMQLSPLLGAAIIVIGAVTALFAAFICRVQTDIKCSLSFASLTQVGIIVVEIGLSLYEPLVFFRYIALMHILGHGCLRTLQFVRAPNLLYDYKILENALGEHISHGSSPTRSRFSERMRLLLYRLAIERGFLDAILNEYVARPFMATFAFFDRLERRWIMFLSEAGHPAETQNLPRSARPVTLADDVE